MNRIILILISTITLGGCYSSFTARVDGNFYYEQELKPASFKIEDSNVDHEITKTLKSALTHHYFIEDELNPEYKVTIKSSLINSYSQLNESKSTSTTNLSIGNYPLITSENNSYDSIFVYGLTIKFLRNGSILYELNSRISTKIIDQNIADKVNLKAALNVFPKSSSIPIQVTIIN